MADHLSSKATSAIDDIIKREVASVLLKLSPDKIVSVIGQRPDHQIIYGKLFNQLHANSVLRMINARKDSDKICTDIFKNVVSKRHSPIQSRQDVGATGSSTNTRVYVAASTQADMVEVNPVLAQSKSPKVAIATNLLGNDASAPKGGYGSNAYAYIALSIPFEHELPGMSAWALRFMNSDEFCDIGPKTNLIDGTPKAQRTMKGLFRFIKFLNPAYLCYRAEDLYSHLVDMENALPQPGVLRDVIKSWNEGRLLVIDNTHKAFEAVQCFKEYERDLRVSPRNGQSTSNAEYDDIESNCEAFGAKVMRKRLHGTEKSNLRKMIRLGARLSSLLDDFGGEAFLLLFPLDELALQISERLEDTYMHHYPWLVLRNLLEESALGCFFRSFSKAIGDPLLAKMRGENIQRDSLVERQAAFYDEYYLGRVTYTSMQPNHEVEPEPSALVYCTSRGALRLSRESSLRPSDMMQFIDGELKEDIVRYLIHQRLPDDWTIVGKNEISQVASEQMLLHNFQGIIIPLCIDDGWILFCYTNPTRSNVTYPITCLNPTRSKKRYLKALGLLRKWIPMIAGWLPKEISA